jgi:hypothetical protein
VGAPTGFEQARAVAAAFSRAATRAGVPVVYAVSYGHDVEAQAPSAPAPAPAEVVVAPAAAPEPAGGDGRRLLDVVGVTLTPMRFVITRDGQRLFEGSPLPGGWTVSLIESDKITLSGEDETRVLELGP